MFKHSRLQRRPADLVIGPTENIFFAFDGYSRRTHSKKETRMMPCGFSLIIE